MRTIIFPVRSFDKRSFISLKNDCVVPLWAVKSLIVDALQFASNLLSVSVFRSGF